MTFYVEVFASKTGLKQNERVVTRRSCQSLKAVNDALSTLWLGVKVENAQLESLPLELSESIAGGPAYRGIRVRR